MNPFHVLGLPVDADNETIARRGQELSDLAESDTDRERYGRAVRELIGDPGARRLHELLEAPGAAYRDERWAEFDRRHRRNPANLDALAGCGPLRTADFDLSAIIRRLLDELLVPPAVDLAAGVRSAPVPPDPGPPPLEVSDVLFG
jgi:hypothetical protein